MHCMQVVTNVRIAICFSKGEEKLTVYYHVSLPGIFLFTDLIVSRESVSILVRNKTFQCIKAKTKSVRQKEQWYLVRQLHFCYDYNVCGFF